MEPELVVDPFTQSLLRIVHAPEHEKAANQTLRTFFHETRNRLVSIRLSLYLARHAGPSTTNALWNSLDTGYQNLAQLVEYVQLICRSAPFDPCHVTLGGFLNDRLPCWCELFARQGRTLEILRPTSEKTGHFDPTLLLKGIESLLSWRSAIGHPGDPAHLSWSCNSDSHHFDWHEPLVKTIDPAERLEGQVASVALPLLSRVMKAHGGKLHVSSTDGLRVGLRWPIQANL